MLNARNTAEGKVLFTNVDDCREIARKSKGIVVMDVAEMINVKFCPWDHRISKTAVVITAVCAMVFFISIIVASICCCRCLKKPFIKRGSLMKKIIHLLLLSIKYYLKIKIFIF